MDSGCTSKGVIAHSPSPRPLSDSECTTPQFCSVDENTREATNDTLLSPTEEHEVQICLFDKERSFPSFLDSLCSSLDLLCTGQCKSLSQLSPPPPQPRDYCVAVGGALALFGILWYCGRGLRRKLTWKALTVFASAVFPRGQVKCGEGGIYGKCFIYCLK